MAPTSGEHRPLPGVDVHRVVEILVRAVGSAADEGPERRGSGYLISADRVLTSAHVVAASHSIAVRLDADTVSECTCAATVRAIAGDIAVLSVDRPPALEGSAPAGLGTFTEAAGVVEMHAIGFPRFKMRNDAGQPGATPTSRFRDMHHAVGWCAVLSNRRSGTLELTVTAPAADPTSANSPWEGMSGAAVWVAGRIVGVVSYDDRADGLDRLTVSRLDRAIPRAGYLLEDRLWDLFGNVTMSDVTPRDPGAQTLSAYHEQVHDIAPAENLLDRPAELDELAMFCAEDAPYIWWQGGPWTGKSALMAWFVLHPPPGLDVIAFFITGLLSGQADGEAFTDAMLDQLSAYVGQQLPQATTPSARDGHRRRLLREAAEHARARARRLVLLIDGLDEDTGPRHGQASIASLLPKRPPGDVRVIVAGRDHPPLSNDVAADHPLRTCRRRTLAPSPHAQDAKFKATLELDRLLAGDDLQRDVVGIVTASGGGLTTGDLYELTRHPPFAVDRLLGGALGRTIRGRTVNKPSDTSRVYVFAHETLRSIAEQRLGTAMLAEYRERVQAWADGYRQAGWPDNTPRYLLAGYPRMNEHVGDWPRLVSDAIDVSRQARLFAVTGGDAAALAEIRVAFDLARVRTPIPLEALARLAVHRVRLSQRNWRVPPGLPAAWAALGRFTHAEKLAAAMPEDSDQSKALAGLAEVAAQAGQFDRAARTAQTIVDADWADQVLAVIASAAIHGSDFDRAQRMVNLIGDPDKQAQAVVDLVTDLGRVGDVDRAETLLAVIDQRHRSQAFGALAGAMARQGNNLRLEELADATDDEFERARALVSMAYHAAAHGDSARALELATAVQRGASSLVCDDRRDQLLSDLVAITGRIDLAQGLAMAERIESTFWRTQAFSSLAGTAIGAGDTDRAITLVCAMADPSVHVQMLIDLVIGAAGAGGEVRDRLLGAARDAVAAIEAPNERGWALADLSRAAAQFDPGLAGDLADEIPDPNLRLATKAAIPGGLTDGDDDETAAPIRHGARPQALSAEHLIAAVPALMRATTATGVDRALGVAERLVERVDDPHRRASLLTDLANIAARLSHQPKARDLAGAAESAARSAAPSGLQVAALIDLAVSTAQRGDADLAARVVLRIESPEHRGQGFAALVAVMGQDGGPEAAAQRIRRAEQAALQVEDPAIRARLLCDLVVAAGSFDPDRVRHLLLGLAARSAADIAEASERLSAFAEILQAGAMHDDWRTVDGKPIGQREVSSGWRTAQETRGPVLVGEGDLLARLGNRGDAEELSRRLDEPLARAHSLTLAAGRTIAAGDLSRGRQLLESGERIASNMNSLDERAEVLADLAGLVARGGNLARGRSLAEEIRAPFWRALAFAELAEVAGRGGDSGRCLALVSCVDDPGSRVQAIVDLLGGAALGASTIGRVLDIARRAADDIGDPDQRARSLADLALVASRVRSQEVAALLSKAAEPIGLVADPAQRNDLRLALSFAAARCHDYQLAEELANAVNDPNEQTRARAAIAHAYADEGPEPGSGAHQACARRLAHTLAHATWRLSLPALARLAPTAVLGMAEELAAPVDRSG